MQNELSREYIGRVISEGIYQAQPTFNHKKENLLALIQYIETLEPTKQNMERAFKLIKFYRFPIIITFRHLYQKLVQQPETDIPAVVDIVKEIASYVASMLESTEIKLFDQIKFIFQLGRSKRKFKFNVTQPEVDFAKFVYELSRQKKAILEEIKITSDYNQKLEDLMSKLDDNIMQRELTPFQEHFIEIIKDSTLKQIQKRCAKTSRQEERQSPPKQQQKKLIPSVHQKQQITPYKQKTQEIRAQSSQNSISRSQDLSLDQEQLPFKQEKLQPMCCRQYFLKGEVIEQSQNLRIQYKCFQYPFVDQKDERPTKSQKIKRVMCGFLNTEGGIIFFGIREDRDSKKRSIKGYYLSEKKKTQFKNDIFTYLKEVLPDLGKHCTIKWVPVKNEQTKHFGSGLFVPKVIIEKGAKDQLYSYLHQGNQKFAFKTENEFLIEQDPQKILKIFSNRVRNPERPIYKLHEHPCKQPLRGKPVYEDKPPAYDLELYQTDFPSLNSSQKYNFEKQYDPTPERKQYQEKWANIFLIQGMTRQQIENDASSAKNFKEFDPITYMVTIQDKMDQNCLRVNNKNVIIHEIFTHIEVNSSEKQIIADIVAQIEKVENTQITINDRSNVLRFVRAENAVKFWLKMQELGIEARFTNKPK